MSFAICEARDVQDFFSPSDSSVESLAASFP